MLFEHLLPADEHSCGSRFRIAKQRRFDVGSTLVLVVFGSREDGPDRSLRGSYRSGSKAVKSDNGTRVWGRHNPALPSTATPPSSASCGRQRRTATPWPSQILAQDHRREGMTGPGRAWPGASIGSGLSRPVSRELKAPGPVRRICRFGV